MFQKIKQQAGSAISIHAFSVVVLLLATFSLNTFADTNAAKKEMRSAIAKLENIRPKKTPPLNRFGNNSNPYTSNADLQLGSTTEKWDHLLPSTEATSKSMAPSTASKAPHTAQ